MSPAVSAKARVERYLRERHQLGFGMESTDCLLRSFARYVMAIRHRGPLTVEVMTDWARRDSHGSEDPQTWARRLARLRGFTRWLRQFEPRTEVPDDAVFGRFSERHAPHIYNEGEIVNLLAAARRLGPKCSLRPDVYETLFGLIASTGLRVCEALSLRIGDVDLKGGMLTIRLSKFGKSRHVPMHASTVGALRRYRRRRDVWIDNDEETPFFVGTRGKRQGQYLSDRQVHRVFSGLREQLGWRNRGAQQNGPRIHDLRHTFIVRRVILWDALGVDIDQAMLSLSTYVGHAKATNTYWYLTAVPELMALVGSRFEAFAMKQEVPHE